MALVNVVPTTDGQYNVLQYNSGNWVVIDTEATLELAQAYVANAGLGNNSIASAGGSTSGLINQLGAVTQAVTVPSNYETYQPFQVAGTGEIAQVLTGSLQSAIQHILSLAFTSPEERVMLPTYGVGVQTLLFSPNSYSEFVLVAQNLQDAFTNTDQAIGTVNVSVVESPQQPGTYAFSVSFTIDQSPVEHQAVFDYQGNLVGAS
jgi:phage baseplate assembly protein W